MKEYTVRVYVDRTEWYLDGQKHRDDGPAIEYPNILKVWYQNGKYHREDGPAVEYSNGDKEWYQNGKRHRVDGPAVDYVTIGKQGWYVNGIKYTEEEFRKRTQQKELTVTEIEKLLGYPVKIIREAE